MDLKDRLASETSTQLAQRRRNAMAAWEKHQGSAKGDEASAMLQLIQDELDARSIPGSIRSFLESYPEGFHDPEYIRKERKDKLNASQECQALLSVEAFALHQQENPGTLLAAVKRVVSMTNLIQGGFEKPQLLDSIHDPANSQTFLAALKDLLHGTDEAPERLERFSDYMDTIGRRKWTYGTYFLFLNDPNNCMFVKPESLKKAIDIAGYPMEYGPEPTADRYEAVLAFAHSIKQKLLQEHDERLHPEDMIDTQGFIWHMAPTGKHAR